MKPKKTSVATDSRSRFTLSIHRFVVSLTALPRSLSNIKKSAVQRGEDISKKIGEMSCNFGEIIKKLYFLVWWKARQRATHATPPTSPRAVTAPHVLDSKCGSQVQDLLARITCGRGGRAG